ncbi:uncharacterized protein [Haliotis cracherodii]|uniref:uncharacterized protein n=1 Tax=Haliotis cracherodii TaxID=6455 RepID=UPI0039EBE627
MKAALLVLILLPLACGNILDTFKHLFNVNELKSVVTKIVHAVGTDATEHACEGACHVALTGHIILVHSCPLVCKSFQQLVHMFHLR